ncbi:MAG: efflux RND transporter periplasmic adaptor subunit [Chryseosolibacter sp.]
MQTKNLVYILIVAAWVVLNACASKQSEPEAVTEQGTHQLSPEQTKLASVQTGGLEYRLISGKIACTGEIEVPPQGMASVAAPLGGYVVETTMVPGTFVKKGQMLAMLSNPEYIVLQQSYLETSGQLKFAEQDFSRQKTLQEQNATAAKKLQESEASYSVLKARLAGLKEQLKMIGISLEKLDNGSIQSVVMLRAPITGYVTEVNHHPGEFVEARESIFEIVNLEHLHLHLNVFEQDISGVQKDQNIRFRPTGSNGETFLGKVLLVSPQRDMEARSFDVHGHIETGEDKLKPGMYVEAEILLSADSLPALPENAVVYSENKSYVVTQENGKFALEAVETGVTMDGWVEIRNHELLRNKKVVTDGASRIFTALRRGE